MASPVPESFLPAALYGSDTIADLEVLHWAPHFWHPVTALAALPRGHGQAFELLGEPVLLSHGADGELRAFRNRCPHRAVAFLEPAQGPVACRRLVCPYHGWTYSPAGELLAAARESEFLAPFERRDWPLEPLGCQVRGSLIWVSTGRTPIPLEQQLDLVIQEAGSDLERPRRLLAVHEQSLACNWKIAHDNTLDDYHVAIAHPTTLHRLQGPVKHYEHRFGTWANLLATPWIDPAAPPAPADREADRFLTFGLPPWNHLLLWPDGRLASIQFIPVAPDRCRMRVLLLGPEALAGEGEKLMEEMVHFLNEDKALVESAQRGYGAGFRTGPPHRLEARILHQQTLYRERLGKWL